MATITLPDDILYKLFQELPIKTLSKLNIICRQWHQVINMVCKMRRTINLENELFDDSYPKVIASHTAKGFVEFYLSSYGDRLESFQFIKESGKRVLDRIATTARFEMNACILHGLISLCPNLKRLHICKQIFGDFLTFQLLQFLPTSLRELRIEMCRLDEAGDVDGLISSIFRQCSLLSVFSIFGSTYGYFEVTDTALINVPTSIKHLDVSGGFSVCIATLNWITGAANLEELFLERTEFFNDDLKILVSSCPNLRKLTITFSKNVSNFGYLSQLTCLEYLTLDGNRDNFDDTALQQICLNCTRLKFLSLENCRQLTDASLMGTSKLTKLHHLDLCSVPNVDDTILHTLCNCIELKTLQLKFCKRVSKQGLRLAASTLRNLTLIGSPFDGRELSREETLLL